MLRDLLSDLLGFSLVDQGQKTCCRREEDRSEDKLARNATCSGCSSPSDLFVNSCQWFKEPILLNLLQI